LYLPSAGAFIAVAAGAEVLARKVNGRGLTYTLLGALILAGAARTWTRNADWKSDVTLWSAALEAAPGSARVQTEFGRAQMALAEEAAQSGRAAEAERRYQLAQTHYQKALDIYPAYALPMDGLASILATHQRFDEALVLYERAVRVWPGNYASLTNWAGLLWDRSTRTAARAAELRASGKAAEADDLDRMVLDDAREALEKVDRAIAMRPSYAHAHLVRALLLDASDPAAAIAEFEEVLRLMPSHPQRQMIEQELQHLRGRPLQGGTTR
jgi:tetratricopeptide (TPR) repeat protein